MKFEVATEEEYRKWQESQLRYIAKKQIQTQLIDVLFPKATDPNFTEKQRTGFKLYNSCFDEETGRFDWRRALKLHKEDV